MSSNVILPVAPIFTKRLGCEKTVPALLSSCSAHESYCDTGKHVRGAKTNEALFSYSIFVFLKGAENL